jgi:septal ring factor EnvC (AmiA/AmiB activator)
MSSKKSKKSEVKVEIQNNPKVRDYSQAKVESDIKKTESAIAKLETDIKNHEQIFKDKGEELKELKKKLDSFKFIKNNLPLVTV